MIVPPPFLEERYENTDRIDLMDKIGSKFPCLFEGELVDDEFIFSLLEYLLELPSILCLSSIPMHEYHIKKN